MKKIMLLCIFCGLFLNALYAQNPSKIKVLDTRSVNSEPSFYKSSVSFEFKYSDTLRLKNTSVYGGLMTFAPWADSSGNKNHQLFFSDKALFYRTGKHGEATWYPWQRILIQNSNGQVGINTTNTQGYTLAVNGDIRAKEIKVESGWADFVFDKDYKLPSLAEVEKHIKENGHLEGIPTETDVKENGVNLGEMNAKLLQKVEELTLYLIEHEKENRTKDACIKQLIKRVNTLEKQIQKRH